LPAPLAKAAQVEFCAFNTQIMGNFLPIFFLWPLGDTTPKPAQKQPA
jgi:hypothetical protein